LWSEIINDVQRLVRQAAGPRHTLALSPEAARLLQAVAPAAQGGAASESVAEDAVVAPSGDVAETLAAMAATVAECRKCGLCETRTQTVFGVGNAHADLVFVGEAPGAEEDRQGIPFVGAAGQLLTRIVEKGMGLSRDDVYICNVLKCRPPDNRDPKADEVEQCEPYLREQLAHIRPKVICALGGHAAKTLLRTTESTGRLRGQWHSYEGIPLRVTYHPSYLLRSRNEPERHKADKRKVWEDVQAVMRVLNGEEHPENQ
jgi:DNA polymerase